MPLVERPGLRHKGKAADDAIAQRLPETSGQLYLSAFRATIADPRRNATTQSEGPPKV